MRSLVKLAAVVLLSYSAYGVSKPHVIGFGKPIAAKWYVGADESRPVDIKVRGLYVDGRLKEFTLGQPHDVTDHYFVVRRAFHFNDALPDEQNTTPKWKWQRGGWLLVDRVSGHISQVPLPEFDTYYSASSWYRDYIAYCGVSDDGKKLFAVVAQLGRRKPVLKKPIGGKQPELNHASPGQDSAQPASREKDSPDQAPKDTNQASRDTDNDNDLPDSGCSAPVWQRQPARVTFASKTQPFTYSILGHALETLVASDDEEGAQ